MRIARRIVLIAAGTCAIAAVGANTAFAAPGGGGGATCSINTVPDPAVIDAGQSVDFQGNINGGNKTFSWQFDGGDPANSTAQNVTVTYNTAGTWTAHLTGTSSKGTCPEVTVDVTVNAVGGDPQCSDGIDNDNDGLIDFPADPGCTDASDDDETDPVFPQCSDGIDNDNDGLTDYPADPGCTDANDDDEADPVSPQCSDGIDNDGDGLIDFPDDPGCDDANDDNEFEAGSLPNQVDFKMMMNYELGMHCTGFEFAYCCVLPVYNSILSQVVKPEAPDATHGGQFPRLLDASHDNNVASILDGGTGDVLGRHTVVRDLELHDGTDGPDGEFKKYVMRYWHDAQPRNGAIPGAPQNSTLISNVELHSLLAWNTLADAASEFSDGTLRLSGGVDKDDPDYPNCLDDTDPSYPCDTLPLYNGASGVVLGDGSYSTEGHFPVPNTPVDNYQNAVWNHLYIYADTEGTGITPAGDRPDSTKLRLGLDVAYPTNFGPAGHGMEGLLTWSEDSGTVVATQMKVLEDLPIMLTSPRIWEALGLPLTPFEDTINFFGDPGAVDEDSIRPYVEMKAQLYHADCDANGDCTEGLPVMGSDGNPVIGFGTAPIDIPNCERCHSAFNVGGSAPNSPNGDPSVPGSDAELVQMEIDFWKAYYPTLATGSDWYARLKGAAISILAVHDSEHGTSFTEYYPAVECADANCTTLTAPVAGSVGDMPGVGTRAALPQNTRLGHESVICQKCHADNVIAVVKSAYCDSANNNLCSGPGDPLIPPLTEAIHYNHREVSEGGPIHFADGIGRSGGCQGCHPAHRSDGDMSGYPITLDGDNFYEGSDNRDANGGCFVGRDVHSNPMKDSDGAETPSHLNAVGEWLRTNVAEDSGTWKGIWCTNCHSQAGQQLWKAENVADLVNAQPGDAGHVREPSENASLVDVVNAVNAALGTTTSETTFIEWLDPGTHRAVDRTHAIWAPDPGLCDYVVRYVGAVAGGVTPEHDATVATVNVMIGGPEDGTCATGTHAHAIDVDCGPVNGGPRFQICGSKDTDGDFNVAVVGTGTDNAEDGPLGGVFCTTPDCVANAQVALGACNLQAGDNCAVPVPFSAATDGRDHWLAPGEPHCADCHAAPYVEQSGNVNAFPPFNYPRKASLMRYSRGHQDITCQGCHESIHGLYPVTPTIDTTTYAQAASLNSDDTHGPLKCGTCHEVDSNGIPTWMRNTKFPDGSRIQNYDDAVTWMHTFTDEAAVLQPNGVCENCHKDRATRISEGSGKWLRHSYVGRIGRQIQDKAEIEAMGHVAGALDTGDGQGGLPDGNPDRTVADITGPGGFCEACHQLNGGPDMGFYNAATCDNPTWKNHLIQGRMSASVWEVVSEDRNGSTCGW